MRAARRYLRTQPFSASSTLLFAVVPGAGTATNSPELVTARSPDDGETRGRAARREPLSRCS